MRITESCAQCLYNKQEKRSQDPAYLAEVRELLEHRLEGDTAPYMVYRFNCLHEKMFGKSDAYADVKKQFNQLVLSMEADIRKQIETAPDPLKRALFFARTGNYIDFGAMNHVTTDRFLALLEDGKTSRQDEETYASFVRECEKAKTFLLICDNCGEIVFDKLLVEQLMKRFPALQITVMVRGGDILNDATMEDAVAVGMTDLTTTVSNGKAIGGTVYKLLSAENQKRMDHADVILAKGQGNYESMTGQGYHAFYTFLCKCDLFTSRFQVPYLTGMFVEEQG